MLFPEEHSEHLKKWIVNRLGATSDADPDVLAEYMLALLRHQGEVNEVRALCETEIPDFLGEGASAFVADVFDAILYGSYLPGAPPAPTGRSAAPFAPPSGPSAPTYGGAQGMPGAPSGPQNGSRKRTYNDRGDGDGDGQDSGYQPGFDPNGRSYKQARRGGMMGQNQGRGEYNNANGRGGFTGRGGHMNAPHANFQGMPPMPTPPTIPGMPPIDPNNPLAAILAMQQMQQALGLPPPPQLNANTTAPQRRRCRDYDQKGFCARGNACKFEHGQDSIFVPPANSTDEYDPSNSSLMTGVENTGAPGFTGGRGRGGGFKRGNDRGGHTGRRGGRAEFSSDRPNFDQSKTSIVVEQIPEEKFEEAHVREFFSEFGNIVEVKMQPYKRLAIVKFDAYAGAKAAYDSPKVIFDNRFVKVYWYTNPDNLPQPPSHIANGSAPAENGSATKTAEPEIDPVEFAKKQDEAQKAHEEKMKKKQEVEAARLELDKRLESAAEEKRQLMAKIAAMSTKKTDSPTESGTPAGSETMSEAQKLLAKLEAEAQSLGLDSTLTDSNSWAGRGRGRGRGTYRGRATFAPRGLRGGYRGRGGSGAPYAGGGSVYKLDNRTKKVGLKGVDFTAAGKEESLREYLFSIDTTADVEITHDLTTVLFKDRPTAEKLFYNTPGCDIPSVGKVEMVWVPMPAAPAKKNEDDGDAMAAAPTETKAYEENPQQQNQNLDYDIADADDGDWQIQ